MLPSRLEEKRKATRRVCKEEEEARVERERALTKVRSSCRTRCFWRRTDLPRLAPTAVLQAFAGWRLSHKMLTMEADMNDKLLRQIELIRRQREMMLKNAPHLGDLFYRWRWCVTVVPKRKHGCVACAAGDTSAGRGYVPGM